MPSILSSPSFPAAPARSQISRIQGALWGLFLGDSLGMPTRFYENRTLLRRDYGALAGLERPRHPHPESRLWRETPPLLPPEWDAFHGRRELWARPGSHPHATLGAGDCTLDAIQAALLMQSLEEQGEPNAASFHLRLEKHLRPGGGNRDLWMHTPLRTYLANRAAGRAPGRFAESSRLTAGLVTTLPLALWYLNDSWAAQQAARRHLEAFMPGEIIPGSLGFLAGVCQHLLADERLTLGQLVFERLDRLAHGVLNFPYRRYLTKDDDEVLGQLLPLSENVEEGLPAALYLALKYEKCPRDGLIANALAGGDTSGRGALLGFLLGLTGGLEALPEEWLTGLEEFELFERLIGGFASRLCTRIPVPG